MNGLLKLRMFHYDKGSGGGGRKEVHGCRGQICVLTISSLMCVTFTIEIGVKKRHVVKRGCNSNSPNGVNCFMRLLHTHVVSNMTG